MSGDQTTVIELEGRKFLKGYKPSFKNHLWLMNEVMEARLDNFDVPLGEPGEETARRMMGKVLAGGKMTTIVGAMLLPEGVTPKQWTPEIAAQVTTHLDQLTESADHDALMSIAAGLLIGFFANRTASLWTSPKSSPSASPPPPAAGPGSSTVGSRTAGAADGA